MSLPVLVPGILIGAAGAWCLLSPSGIVDLGARMLAHPGAKWFSAGLRLVLGALLVAGAGSTRHPGAVVIAGVALVVVGVVLLALPRPRFEGLARWGLGLPAGTLRLAGLAALALGAWLAWAATAGPPA